jgi:hypothetical protein
MDHERDEVRLLQALLQGRFSDAGVLARAVDPARFVARCRESDVVPWVHARLVAQGDLRLPEIVDGLARLRAKVARDNLLLLARAERALDALAAARVTPLALKGLDVVHRLYTRFDERTMTDIDLLVRRPELARALDALERAGFVLPPPARRAHYVRTSHHLPLLSPGPVPVGLELHWSLAQEVRFRIDVEGLFERSEPLDVAGRRLRRLADHDLAAHLLLHHFAHYFDRGLKWAVDLQLVSGRPGFRWPAVTARLHEWGAAVPAAFAVRHLARSVPDWIPAEVLAALPVSRWRLLLLQPLTSNHPLELFRSTGSRAVQLWLAAVLWERPWLLPWWLVHRARRGERVADHPLERAASGPGTAGPGEENP